MITTQHSIMELLRDETAQAHRDAESHAFQKALIKGELPREQYVAHLGQLYVIHAALEEALQNAGDSDARLAGMAEAATMHREHLEMDIRDLGGDPAHVQPTPAAAKLADEIRDDATTDPVLLAGTFYVLEGSMNGNSFIARPIAAAYRLEAPTGLRYLHSYGEEQRGEWAAFKERMGAMKFTDAERGALVDRAKRVFHAIAGVGDALLA